MAMIVKNNLAAVRTLSLLNKNSKAAQKSLRQASTGMKITGAQDDASGYAISERMRVAIRALDQAHQNVQNGSSLLKIADGGINNIVEEIRSLKELAINAANDSNTDEDRRTIQKEFLQRMDTINDIATTTAYNGKTLLDGTYEPKTDYNKVTGTALQVIGAFMAYLDKTALTGEDAVDEAINNSTEGRFKTKNALVNRFMSDLENSSSYTEFLADKCGIILDNADTGAITGSDAGGDTVKTAESIVPEQIAVTSWGVPTSSTTTINGLTVHWPVVGANGTSLTAAEEHILAGLNSDWIEQATNLVTESVGLSFNEKGTTVRDIEVTFENNPTSVRYRYSEGKTYQLNLIINMNTYKDIDVTSEHGALLPSSPNYTSTNYLDRSLAAMMTYAIMAANIYDYDALPSYIRNGMADLVRGIDDLRPNTMKRLLTTRKKDLEDIFSAGGTKGDATTYAAGYMFLRYLANQRQHPVSYNPLVIQTGTQAGQHVNFYIKDMHTKSLGAGKLFDSNDNLTNSSDIARYNALSGDSVKQAEWLATLKAAQNKTLDDISVTTRENANIAIRVLDGALEYALDEATTIGAYLQRLEYTADNVTTSNENVQAAESTIRDADMAKTMTDYTKNNVLLQAAQAMLAQANQNSSAVLALLR